MKKHLSFLIALVLVLTSLIGASALAERTTYAQAPMLDALVASGNSRPSRSDCRKTRSSLTKALPRRSITKSAITAAPSGS